MYWKYSSPGDFNDKEEDEYNEIDRIHMAGIEYATNRCRKLFIGILPCSPTLQYARDRVVLWTYVIKKIKEARASVQYIHRLDRRVIAFNITNVTLNEAKRNYLTPILDISWR